MPNRSTPNPDAINTLPSHALPRPDTLTVEKEKARQRIAYIVVIAYVLLVAANIAIPTVLYMQYKPDYQSLNIDNVKDLMLAISSILSGLVGILGFVVGYYFKSIEQDKKESLG